MRFKLIKSTGTSQEITRKVQELVDVIPIVSQDAEDNPEGLTATVSAAQEHEEDSEGRNWNILTIPNGAAYLLAIREIIELQRLKITMVQ
jgi:hypothetical protein